MEFLNGGGMWMVYSSGSEIGIGSSAPVSPKEKREL